MVKRTMMVRNRPYTLRSLTGHTLRFEGANKPVAVPPEVVREALEVGAVPIDDNPVGDQDEVVNAVPVEPQGEERKELILAAMDNMKIENKRADFTSGGAPHVDKLSARVGFSVHSKERDKFWVEHQAHETTEE